MRGKIIPVAFILLLAVAGSAAAQSGYPDFVISNVKVEPVYAGVGEAFRLRFDLKNIGTMGSAGATVKIVLSAGIVYSSSSAIACAASGSTVNCGGSTITVAPGSALSAILFLKAPSTAGPMQFNLEADPGKTVKELREDNNKASAASQSYVRPQVQVTSNFCASSPRPINQPFAIAFKLKNVGTVSVRYPALSIQIGGGSQPVTITSVVPTSGAVPLNNAQTNHSFTYAWGNQLAVGGELVVTLNMKTAAAATVKGTAKALVENDNTAADNSATCTVTVQ